MTKKQYQHSEEEKTVISIGGKTYILSVRDFSNNEIDIEDLLQIDISNIAGDVITFPVLFNRIARIKAEMDNFLALSKSDFNSFEAEKWEFHKKKLLGEGEKATEKNVEMAILRDPEFKIKKHELLKIQKEADIIDGFYWSAKSKDGKLDKISHNLTPTDFEKNLLEDTINSVKIRVQKNMFKDKR